LSLALLDRIQTVFPALRGVPAPLAAELGRLQSLTLPAGCVMFDVGTACSGFPLLLAGEIRVQTIGANGRMLHLYRVIPGGSCVITQSCLLGRRNYNAQGSARSEVELCMLPAALFNALLGAHPPFREFVFALFGERLIELMAIVDEVAFKRLDQRLARLLLERGPRLRTTHQALADDLGSVREIVTRLLRQFADEGLVELARESIQIRDSNALAVRASSA
jgi:CRP/FNR family transcriptional regulator